MKFDFTKDGFYFDGKKTKIISGAMHYFRIFPEYWEDRLLKLKELGANCVETYCAWNLHEANEGSFDFSDRLDLVRYIETAKKLGLYVILRPGPYICSECDMGGLPWWLLSYDDVSLRAFNKRFLDKTEIYLSKICDKIKPHLITNGGNVIMIQIENEYGCVGSDKRYLNALRNIYLKNGIDVPFFTCDWEAKENLESGSIDGAIPFVNYRWNSEVAIPKLKSFSPDTPSGVMELWNGSAMLVGKPATKRDLNEVKISVEGALKHAELMNLYMFHGGTNFGFFNGAQYQNGKFVVQATSYDVQAPIGEYGNRTEKYYIEQKAICDYLNKPIVSTASDPKLVDYGKADYVCAMPLSSLDRSLYRVNESKKILPMEKFGQAHGCIAYTTNIESDGNAFTLKFDEVHDLASVYVDGDFVSEVARDGEKSLVLNLSKGTHELTFFVEEFGRINFGLEIFDPKGLVGDVVMLSNDGSEKVLKDYVVTSYPFEKVVVSSTDCERTNIPMLYKFDIELTPVGDTYLEIDGFTRGVVFINGVNLGRHFNLGPQKSLYVPKRLLKNGKNEIIVFDARLGVDEKRVLLSGKQIITGYTD